MKEEILKHNLPEVEENNDWNNFGVKNLSS